LTSVGVRRWEDLSGVIGRIEVNELQMSYRQGPKVLEIAEDIYRRATERDHEFVSYFNSSDEEPNPLFKQINSNQEEVEWLVKRILEIYRAHGNKIPSIAIFVPDESDVNKTAEIINDFQELVELDVKCVPCNQGQALGDSNSLRVFSIDYIKGLEFEAVFFLNIDKVLETRGRRIGLRLIYVGLSRAAFYLGITSYEPLASLRLSEGFKEKSNW
jgi:superfamily I DNA/RNA helicase